MVSGRPGVRMTPGAAASVLALLAGRDVSLLRFSGSATGEPIAWMPVCIRSDRDVDEWCFKGPSDDE